MVHLQTRLLFTLSLFTAALSTFQQIEDDITQATKQLVKLNATIWSFPDNGGTVAQIMDIDAQRISLEVTMNQTIRDVNATRIANGAPLDGFEMDDVFDLANAALPIIADSLTGLIAKRPAIQALVPNVTSLIIQGLESIEDANNRYFEEFTDVLENNCQRQEFEGTLGGLIPQLIFRVIQAYEGETTKREAPAKKRTLTGGGFRMRAPGTASKRTLAQVETDLELINSQIHLLNDSVWLFRAENVTREKALDMDTQVKNMEVAIKQTTADLNVTDMFTEDEAPIINLLYAFFAPQLLPNFGLLQGLQDRKDNFESLGADIIALLIQDLQSIKAPVIAMAEAIAGKMPNRCWGNSARAYFESGVVPEIDTVIALYEE